MGFFGGVVKKSLGVFAKIGGGWVNIYMEVVGTEVGASGGCGFWWVWLLVGRSFERYWLSVFVYRVFGGMGRNVWKYCIFADGGGWAAALR